MKMNTEWSFWLWTDEDNRRLIAEHYPFFLAQYDAYDVKMKRIDASRLFYLHRFGGVYLDLDFACLQPFETLPMPPRDAILSHQYTKWLIRQTYGTEKAPPWKAGTIANNFMIAPPGHPLFAYAIRKLPHFANYTLLFATGPNFLSRAVWEHDQLVNHSGIKTHVTQYYLPRIYATGWKGGALRNPCGEGLPQQIAKCQAEAQARNGSLLATFWTQTWKYPSNDTDAALPLSHADSPPPPPPPPAIAPPPPRSPRGHAHAHHGAAHHAAHDGDAAHHAAADGCSVRDEVNETKVRAFIRMLRYPEEEDVQRDWWYQQAPLGVFKQRIDLVVKNCHPRNGCYFDEPVLVRCSAVPGANRYAAPNHTDQWPLCMQLLDARRAAALGPEPLGAEPAPPSASSEQRPLFYSFGIDNKWNPDDILGRLGFEVHSFDPTTAKRQVHEAHRSAGVHFHYTGLQSSTCHGGHASHTDKFYGKLGGELLSLSTIRQRLGHRERTIGALKIDCEGCEWNVFHEMSRLDPSALDGVAMILTELHMTEQLQMASEADVRKFQEFYEYVIERQGFRFFYHHTNKGAADFRATFNVSTRMKELGAHPYRCCYEIGLVKPSLIQKLLHDERRAGLGTRVAISTL